MVRFVMEVAMQKEGGGILNHALFVDPASTEHGGELSRPAISALRRRLAATP